MGEGWGVHSERMGVPKNKNGAFNSSPIHLPSISSPLSRFIPASQTDNQNETPPSCFIHPPSVFYSFTGASLPLQWLLSFFPPLSLSFCLVCSSCIKKAILSCFSASVCLSMSIWPASRLSGCRWQVGSPSGRPHQADSQG